MTWQGVREEARIILSKTYLVRIAFPLTLSERPLSTGLCVSARHSTVARKDIVQADECRIMAGDTLTGQSENVIQIATIYLGRLL